MRKFGTFHPIATLCGLMLAGSPSFAGGRIVDENAACRLPFERMQQYPARWAPAFTHAHALNTSRSVEGRFRNRYIVAWLDTTDDEGICKGVRERYPRIEEISDFSGLAKLAAASDIPLARLAELPIGTAAPEAAKFAAENFAALRSEQHDLKNYLRQVERFREEARDRSRVYKGHCIGQTVNLCEFREGKPTLVARFLTSSVAGAPSAEYYAAYNWIDTRRWETERTYGIDDFVRDQKLGTEEGGEKTLYYLKELEMPNFLNFVPMPDYRGLINNGIHESEREPDTEGPLGSPTSRGCLRLFDFPAKFARWWTPRHAKVFIHFEPANYRRCGDARTGKATYCNFE